MATTKNKLTIVRLEKNWNGELRYRGMHIPAKLLAHLKKFRRIGKVLKRVELVTTKKPPSLPDAAKKYSPSTSIGHVLRQEIGKMSEKLLPATQEEFVQYEAAQVKLKAWCRQMELELLEAQIASEGRRIALIDRSIKRLQTEKQKVEVGLTGLRNKLKA